MEGKYIFRLKLACLLALIGWVNLGCTSDVEDRCQQLYKNGQYEQAFPVCRKAAEQEDAYAQNCLCLMYGGGVGVQQDHAEAEKWFIKAAEQGDASDQTNLGWMYDHGEGVRQNYFEAVRWFREAAEQGYALAQFNLEVMYAYGRGVPRSGAVAADWYYKAGLSYLKEGKKMMC